MLHLHPARMAAVLLWRRLMVLHNSHLALVQRPRGRCVAFVSEMASRWKTSWIDFWGEDGEIVYKYYSFTDLLTYWLPEIWNFLFLVVTLFFFHSSCRAWGHGYEIMPRLRIAFAPPQSSMDAWSSDQLTLRSFLHDYNQPIFFDLVPVVGWTANRGQLSGRGNGLS